MDKRLKSDQQEEKLSSNHDIRYYIHGYRVLKLPDDYLHLGQYVLPAPLRYTIVQGRGGEDELLAVAMAWYVVYLV